MLEKCLQVINSFFDVCMCVVLLQVYVLEIEGISELIARKKYWMF